MKFLVSECQDDYRTEYQFSPQTKALGHIVLRSRNQILIHVPL